MVVVPNETAVTTPSSETIAISSSELLHTIVLSVVFSGSTVAFKVSFLPIVSSNVSLSRVIEVAKIGFTVTLQVADAFPQVAVIEVSPTETAVTNPVSLTVATDSLLLLHIKVCDEVNSGTDVGFS